MTKEFDILSTKNVMFHLYGTVGASIDGMRVGLGTEKERCMVVPLLRTIRRPVSYLELAAWMGDTTPDEVGCYVREFRHRLAKLGLKGTLTHRDRVCRLNLPPDLVDAHRLTTRVTEAEHLDDRTAAARLRKAIDLCAGDPLPGLTGRRVEDYRHELREERRKAEMALIRVDFRLGHAERHVPDLVRLFNQRPEDTDVAPLTMRALALTGREAEALEVYQRSCERLVELGRKIPDQMAELVPKLESHL
jgi:DNA-binding SARP family transcriptional activator